MGGGHDSPLNYMEDAGDQKLGLMGWTESAAGRRVATTKVILQDPVGALGSGRLHEENRFVIDRSVCFRICK